MIGGGYQVVGGAQQHMGGGQQSHGHVIVDPGHQHVIMGSGGIQNAGHGHSVMEGYRGGVYQ